MLMARIAKIMDVEPVKLYPKVEDYDLPMYDVETGQLTIVNEDHSFMPITSEWVRMADRSYIGKVAMSGMVEIFESQGDSPQETADKAVRLARKVYNMLQEAGIADEFFQVAE